MIGNCSRKSSKLPKEFFSILKSRRLPTRVVDFGNS